MSAGHTHLRASLILASAFSVGAIIISRPEMLECAVGAIVGTIITPDLDVDKAFIGDKIVYKRTGWLGKKLWLFFWKPYKTSMKHGRFASHFPIFGTFVRLLYIFYLLIVPFYAVYFLILRLSNYNLDLIYEGVWWCKMLFVSWYTVGLCASDLIHYCLDIMTKNVE